MVQTWFSVKRGQANVYNYETTYNTVDFILLIIRPSQFALEGEIWVTCLVKNMTYAQFKII